MVEGETSSFGLPHDCLAHLASPLDDPFTPFLPIYHGRGTGADVDVAMLYSAASLMSISPSPPMAANPASRHLHVPAVSAHACASADNARREQPGPRSRWRRERRYGEQPHGSCG
jgi:hypothetical protein